MLLDYNRSDRRAIFKKFRNFKKAHFQLFKELVRRTPWETVNSHSWPRLLLVAAC